MRKIFLTVLVALAIFVSCNSNNSSNGKQLLIVAPSDAPEKHQCPMKCESDTAYTTAGECPVCEMDLVKL